MSQRYIPPEIRKVVVERDNACYYCDKSVDRVVGDWAPVPQRWRAYDNRGVLFHFDHIIPLSAGGLNTADNIVLSCPNCNLKKARTTDRHAARAGRPAMTKVIKVSDEVYDQLEALKTRGETFDLLITDLLAMKQKLSEIMPK